MLQSTGSQGVGHDLVAEQWKQEVTTVLSCPQFKYEKQPLTCDHDVIKEKQLLTPKSVEPHKGQPVRLKTSSWPSVWRLQYTA